MGGVYGKYWKTSKQDVVRFAHACSTVLKHPNRTDEELYAIAEIYDDLMAGRDVINDLRGVVVRKFQSVTKRHFPLTINNSFQNPWDVSANKGQIFKDALLDRGIDLESFDPNQKWVLEPGADTPIKKTDRKKLLVSRGVPTTQEQSSETASRTVRMRSLAIKQLSEDKRNARQRSATNSRKFFARIKNRVEAAQSTSREH